MGLGIHPSPWQQGGNHENSVNRDKSGNHDNRELRTMDEEPQPMCFIPTYALFWMSCELTLFSYG